MTETDHLSNEVSVSARLEEKGITASAKSRAIAALDRLVGSAIDVPTAYFERHAQQIRKNHVPSQPTLPIEILGEQVANRVIKDILSKQENREAVAKRAIEHLQDLPDGESSGESIHQEKIAEDWLNVFEAYAERASSDTLRDLWGRVLAGEIRKPKSFSLTTIRLISELDAEIADEFQSAVRVRIPDGFILKPKDLSGNVLRKLMFLEEIGLVQGVHGHLRRTLHLDQNNFWHFYVGTFVLRAKPIIPPSEMGLIALSRTGREIASILPAASDMEIIDAVAEHVMAAVEFMDICQITDAHEFQTIRVILEQKHSQE